MLRPCVAAVSALVAGCHVIAESEVTRPFATERIAHPEGAIAHRPTIALTDTGRLRFVEPLECPTEDIIQQRTTTERELRPNLATFTVGVLATAVGGVLLTSGLFSSRPGSNLYTFAGLAGVGAGVPLAVGPWLGNRTDEGASEASTVRRPGPSQPCGDRGLAASAATLSASGLEIYGAVDRDGVFAVSAFDWIDAYRPAAAVSAALTARVELRGGPRTIEAVLDADALARRATSYLAHADFDARVEPLKLVPGVTAGALRVSLIAGDGGPAVRVALPLRNDGPGQAWGLRGQLTAPDVPSIDGRMIYVGALARGTAATRELIIPLAPATAAALRGRTIELAVELRDAHGTAPETPVRFRGLLDGRPGPGP